MLSLSHHITFLCKAQDAELSFENGNFKLNDSFDSQHIGSICEILRTAISNGQHGITMSMLVALQTLMKQVCTGQAELDNSAVENTKLLLWDLLSSRHDSVAFEVVKEACNVLRAGFGVFYPCVKQRSLLVIHLLSEGVNNSAMAHLLALLLSDLADNAMRSIPGQSPLEAR